ncbi:MAG: UDP-N-acetylmuramate dehydrogenase [Bryobacteraceae bacterium]
MHAQLARIPGLTVTPNAPLSQYTRFGIGGPTDQLVDAATEDAFVAVLNALRESGTPYVVIGGGSNLIVSDAGYRGVVLRFTGSTVTAAGSRIHVETGAFLQDLVDASIAHGLAGMHTMTRIPGWVGGAVYGNAGAYGHSIQERVRSVRFFDGAKTREFDNTACEFHYRESIFKKHKDWILFSADLEFPSGDPVELRREADEIQRVRDEKYPPSMRCAGSIFKNLIAAELPDAVRERVPEKVVREGKIPSAWFLEQTGAKGMKNGGIEVATYHANLIYNAGGGTAQQVREVIQELKRRVRAQFAFEVEEEVQYVGFD